MLCVDMPKTLRGCQRYGYVPSRKTHSMKQLPCKLAQNLAAKRENCHEAKFGGSSRECYDLTVPALAS